MQIERDTIDPLEDWVVGHDAHVVHRAHVTGQRHSVLIRGVGRRDERVALWDAKALDLDRALRGRRAPLTAQAAEPSSGDACSAPSCVRRRSNVASSASSGIVELGRAVDHDHKHSRSFVLSSRTIKSLATARSRAAGQFDQTAAVRCAHPRGRAPDIDRPGRCRSRQQGPRRCRVRTPSAGPPPGSRTGPLRIAYISV